MVTRPAPDNAPIEATGVWVTPLTELVPSGMDFRRAERKRVLSFSRAEVPTVPRGTAIVAPERDGDEDRTWRADGIEQDDADHIRVLVVLNE